jgi:hypothetical protein
MQTPRIRSAMYRHAEFASAATATTTAHFAHVAAFSAASTARTSRAMAASSRSSCFRLLRRSSHACAHKALPLLKFPASNFPFRISGLLPGVFTQSSKSLREWKAIVHLLERGV